MSEELDPSPLTIKGFNAGYQISQHEPELLDGILKAQDTENEFLHAMKLGRKQYQKEVALQELDAIEKRNQTRKPKR